MHRSDYSDSDTSDCSSLEIIPEPIQLTSPLAKSLLIVACILDCNSEIVQQYVISLGIRNSRVCFVEEPCKTLRYLKVNLQLFLYDNKAMITSFLYGVGLSLLFSTVMYERWINSLYREKYK